jgi:hypothetical protein
VPIGDPISISETIDNTIKQLVEARDDTTGEVIEEHDSIAAEIREKIARGYTFEQLTKQFGYAPTTVRQEMAKVVYPASEGKIDGELPATYKRTEILEPEALLRRYVDGSYEDQLELRGMMKMRAAMLMVMDLINLRKGDAEAFALEVKPIIELMKETRAEQDAAADRARGSSVDIATKAAQETAETVVNYLEQKKSEKPDIASTPDPIKGFMARAMETMWNQINSKLFGGGQQGGTTQLPPGWSDMRNTSQNQQGGQS